MLSTDMSLHFAWIQNLKEFGLGISEDGGDMRSEEAEVDRVMLCQALIKCADISNPVSISLLV